MCTAHYFDTQSQVGFWLPVLNTLFGELMVVFKYYPHYIGYLNTSIKGNGKIGVLHQGINNIEVGVTWSQLKRNLIAEFSADN